MGFYVRLDDLRSVNEGASQQVSKWQEELQSTQSSISDLVGMNSFRGNTAESVKTYYSEVHGLLSSAVTATMIDFMSKYLLYMDGYYEIDGDIHAKLNQDTMEQAIREYQSSENRLENIHRSLRDAVNSTSDIFYPGIPSVGALECGHENAIEKTKEAKDKVQPYENSVLNSAISELETFIANTRAFIREYKDGDRNVMVKYTSGDMLRTDSIYNLAVSMEAASQYSQIHQNELQEAINRQEKVYEQLQAEYEAEMERLAKERADQGVSQMILGGVAVVVGVAAIVCTAGAATPVVVAAAVTGTCTVAYGTSEMIEGGQHVMYGMKGDPYTSAFNPIRDTIFMGNQEAYSVWGNLNMTVASMCIPIGKATKGAKGLQAIKLGTKAAAKELIIDQASEAFAGYTAPVIADRLGVESKTGQLLINLGIQAASSGAMDKFADNLEIKHEINKIKADVDAGGNGFAGLMDDADAARYEAWQIKIEAEQSGSGFAGLMDDADAARYEAWMTKMEAEEFGKGFAGLMDDADAARYEKYQKIAYGTDDIKNYKYNMIENPGSLAEGGSDSPASNFFGGRYNEKVLTEDTVYFRAGNSDMPYGSWFTNDPPLSEAQVRIDCAVRNQWIDKNGSLTAYSDIDTAYEIKIPKGTTVYEGPVAPQGGVYLGGPDRIQIYIPGVRDLDAEIISKKPLK